MEDSARLDQLWLWANELNEFENWIQLVILIGSIVFAVGVSHLITKYLLTHSDELGRRDLKRLTRQSLKRVVFPLLAFLILFISQKILNHYQMPTQLLNLAVPLLLSFAGIRLLLYVLRKAFRSSPLLKAWESILAISIWGIFVLYMFELLIPIRDTMQGIGFSMGKSQITLLSVIESLVYIAIFFTLALWFSAYLERRLSSSSVINASVKVALAKFFKFAVITFAILIALDIAGIDLTALTVFGGALGVGLGFGLQRIASNFISGFLLIFDKSIKPGDTISIGTKFGWVEELRARYIVVRDRDGVDTLIPNENLITSEVINWSYRDPNVRLKLPVSISYHDDPELAMKLMLEAADETNRVLKDPVPAARLMAFGDNGIELELRLWINDPQTGLNNVRSEANLLIWKKFKAAGITIPFPQRDVHVIPAKPLLDNDDS